MAENDIVIVGAARTAVGAFNGAFANTPAHDLGSAAIKDALKRAKVDAGEVDEVIMGQILTAAQGQNPARQASIAPACRSKPGLGPQPAVRLGPARGGARLSGRSPTAIRQHRRRRRPGIDVAGAACAASARRVKDGRRRSWSTP
jgi:hypothetical protein